MPWASAFIFEVVPEALVGVSPHIDSVAVRKCHVGSEQQEGRSTRAQGALRGDGLLLTLPLAALNLIHEDTTGKVGPGTILPLRLSVNTLQLVFGNDDSKSLARLVTLHEQT